MRARVMLWVPLILFLLLWLWLLFAIGAFRVGPNGTTFGTDFAMFFGATETTLRGGNAYDPAQTYKWEYRTLHRQGVMVTTPQYVRVANPPLFYVSLEPLTRLPFQTAAYIWMTAMFALSIGGVLAAMRHFGQRLSVLPVLIFAAMPQNVLATYYANVNGAVLASLGVGLLLSPAAPVIAGAIMSFAWLKPQVGLPAVLLIGLVQPGVRRSIALGFAGATAIEIALSILVMGTRSLTSWWGGLSSFSNATNTYYDVASTSGLYGPHQSHAVSTVLSVSTIVAALALTALWWWKHRAPDSQTFESIAWLWPVWMLAVPFDHLHDEVLLSIPLLALWYSGTRSWRLPVATYLLFLSIIALVWKPAQIDLICLPLVGVALCMIPMKASSGHSGMASAQPVETFSSAI